MADVSREEQLRLYAAAAVQRMTRLADRLAARQLTGGTNYGNVPPWPDSEDPDFHGTLAAVWVWTRVGQLTHSDRFQANINEGWSFVKAVWPRFIPEALSPSGGEESSYDCAMVLRAALADVGAWDTQQRRASVDVAARLLAAHLFDQEDAAGREFRDPGFLAWNLVEYARTVNDRGLLAGVRKFVDRAFGMRSPPPFAAEAAVTDDLFDFSSTSAMRVMAVSACEGPTPFLGAWLRERIAPMAPTAFLPRAMDEHTWNACVAMALGRAFVVATAPALFEAYRTLLDELGRRDDLGAGLGRQPGHTDETSATFYYALALDAVTKT